MVMGRENVLTDDDYSGGRVSGPDRKVSLFHPQTSVDWWISSHFDQSKINGKGQLGRLNLSPFSDAEFL